MSNKESSGLEMNQKSLTHLKLNKNKAPSYAPKTPLLCKDDHIHNMTRHIVQPNPSLHHIHPIFPLT